MFDDDPNAGAALAAEAAASAATAAAAAAVAARPDADASDVQYAADAAADAEIAAAAAAAGPATLVSGPRLFVNGLFDFSGKLGDDYSGEWTDDSTFVVTLLTVGDAAPVLGTAIERPFATTGTSGLYPERFAEYG